MNDQVEKELRKFLGACGLTLAEGATITWSPRDLMFERAEQGKDGVDVYFGVTVRVRPAKREAR